MNTKLGAMIRIKLVLNDLIMEMMVYERER